MINETSELIHGSNGSRIAVKEDEEAFKILEHQVPVEHTGQ